MTDETGSTVGWPVHWRLAFYLPSESAIKGSEYAPIFLVICGLLKHHQYSKFLQHECNIQYLPLSNLFLGKHKEIHPRKR